ncbi:hypothetical protein GCM10009850_107400 [Nonomuraea monospora]|uniref:NAD(P)-binding domain-containing protein n=1 Tax=Nonomuraea monospora TaxID=568818 RepID=A0ABN3D0K7_9ACTN
MIAVSAASGALGRLVIDRLRTRTEVVAVVRDPVRAPAGVQETVVARLLAEGPAR